MTEAFDKVEVVVVVDVIVAPLPPLPLPLPALFSSALLEDDVEEAEMIRFEDNLDEMDLKNGVKWLMNGLTAGIQEQMKAVSHSMTLKKTITKVVNDSNMRYLL